MRTSEGTEAVATLNGTLCAITRMIILLLENHQQADGSVRIPGARCVCTGRPGVPTAVG